MAIRLDLIEREGSARLQILLPVGLYLQAGVKLRLAAKSREIKLPYSWCFSNLCVAAAPIDRNVVRALGEARAITVEVVNANLVTLTVTVPTDQLAVPRIAAYLPRFLSKSSRSSRGGTLKPKR